MESRPRLLPFQGSQKVIIYLTSSGDVCLYDKNASDLPISSIFSLRDVRDVAYNEKKVTAWIRFHAGTLIVAFVGLIWLCAVAFSVVDYILFYDQYYYSQPVADASQTVSEGASGSIFLVVFVLIYVSLINYILKHLADWSDAERIDFILKNDEQISFYGKFPHETRIYLHKLGFALIFFVLMPIAMFKPQLLLFFLVVEILAFGALLFLRTLSNMVFIDSDPDESEGTEEIRGLRAFYDDVSNLSIPVLGSNEGKGKATFSFEHLVDRLSDEVASLSARLQVHEKALDEVTNEKWRYTLRVPEVDQGLNQIRKCTERVLFQRVTDLGITTGPRAGLDEMKSILEKNKAITSKPLSDLEVILAKTSPGSHATTGYAESDDDYIMALRALANLVEWHFDNSDDPAAIEALPEAN